MYTKIIDFINEKANTKNMVLAYHGTPHGVFNKFSMKKRGTGADIISVGDYGRGYYFTPNKEDAISYAKNIGDKRTDIKVISPTLYTVEIKMNKPFDMRIISQIDKEYMVLIKNYGVMSIPDTEYDLLLKKLNITREELDFYRDVESDISDNWGDWDIKSKIKQYGYDSLINYDGSEYVVYDSRNIKIIDVQTL